MQTDQPAGGLHGRRAEIRTLQSALPDRSTARFLADCDILVAATDNHGSRLSLQEIAAAYLRPLINAGVGLKVENALVRRISARVTAPPVGGPWCLVCGGHVDVVEAAMERIDTEHSETLSAQGYLVDTPQPAVYWINAIAAAYAVSMVHALVMHFRGVSSEEPEDLYLDLLSPEVLTIRQKVDGFGCALCGAGGVGRRGVGDAFLTPEEKNLEALILTREEGDLSRSDRSEVY